MNFDQFAASYRNPEEETRCGQHGFQKPEEELVLAGTVLNVTKAFCCIDINGAQYEVDSSDIIDIAVLPKPKSVAAAESADAEKADAERGEAEKQQAEREAEQREAAGQKPEEFASYTETEESREERFPQTALLRVNRNAILWQRTPVPAALLAAVGTWMHVVPAETPAETEAA